MTFLQHLAGIVLTVAAAVGLVAPAPAPATFGALPGQDALIDTYLASGIDADDTSMTLADGTTRDGATLSGYYCFTIDANTAQLEYVCGTASSTSVTSLERGVKPSDPTATSSALAFRHRRFATVQVTDFPFNQLAQRLLNGTDGFEAALKYDGVATSTLATDGDHLASVQYVNDATFDGAGVVQASESSSGFVELATGVEAASSTSSGSAARLALPAAISTSTPPASGHVVPVTGNDGNIDQGFIPSTISQDMTFTGTNSFSTGTTTFATSTTFVGSFPAYGIGKNIQVFTSSGTFTKPSGVDKVRVQVVGGGGDGGSCNAAGGSGEGGGGGGGGGYAMEYVDISATSTITVTVGAGSTGSGGGTSSFSSFLSATGGADGAGTGAAGAGGVGSGGDINVGGNAGNPGAPESTTTDDVGASGSGGGSVLGGGGAGFLTTGTTSGGAGTAYGGGGGGASCNGSSASGGGGQAGVVIVEW